MKNIAKVFLLVVVFSFVGCLIKKAPLIDYKVYGVENDKPTLVLVHGWMSNQKIWDNQVKAFKKDYQMITLDLAGHGQSKAKRGEYTMLSFAKDVAWAIEKAGVKKVVLVGHSMGGPVVLQAAEILGDKAVGIVGVDTFYTPFIWPKTEKEIADFIDPIKKDYVNQVTQMVQSMFGPDAPAELKADVLSGIASSDQEIGMNAMYYLFKWRAENNDRLLKKYHQKLLSINGNPKGDLKPAHSSVVLIKGAAHFPAQTKAKEFNQVLAKFLMGFSSQKNN